MNPKENLIKILNRYITESDRLREVSEKKLTLKLLYEELLTKLGEDYQHIIENRLELSILFTSLYTDDIYLSELYDILINIQSNKAEQQKLKDLIRKLKTDYQIVVNELEEANVRLYRRRYLYKSAKEVVTKLKCNMPIIGKYDIPNVKRILNYYEEDGIISNKEELLLINEIELHNRKSLLHNNKEKKDASYVEGLYNQIPNILNAGYQKHDEIEIYETRKPSLDKIIEEIKNFIDFLPKEDIIQTLKSHYSYNMPDNEYNYILTKILNYYQDSLITFYEFLIDKETYTNIEDRKEVIKNYYVALETYLELYKFYEEINTFTVESGKEEVKEHKKIIFSHSPNSPKAKLMSDMKDIPEEYYNQVTDLLSRFKTDELQPSERKKLSNNRRLVTLIELRDDQIRIILRHVKGNLYCVMGVATKKDDNDMPMYNAMANRLVPNTSNEELLNKELTFAKLTEEQLKKLVKEKGRKGNR